MKKLLLSVAILFFIEFQAIAQKYPQGYFRHPLNIPMELVANFGEIRTNHWHMGLDIRTQQRENLPVYAAAEGYVARVVVEPGGFGQAIYIAHPNGFTTLYAHLKAFYPELEQYVTSQQYILESWRVDLKLKPGQFPVVKGQYIARSGNTGGSQGPHVHFEIRDTQTDKVLNPLLFRFPIPDAVPPTLVRLAMYDRNKSTYTQAPQLLNIQATRNRTVKVGSDKISFAIGAVDRFSGSANPNGIYSARISMDGKPISEFVLDNIDYIETRLMNAQIDYPFSARGGSFVQHITPLPGARGIPYKTYNEDGIIYLKDLEPHDIVIDVKDANFNSSKIAFRVQYDPALKLSPLYEARERLIPNQVNVFERDFFEIYTSEATVYDTVNVSYSNAIAGATNAV
ncbi:MAG TPA: M23 family metallopeptidase, partial [Flavisolibacter sp.]|nr:M23 family metallopeptidase [Flavisolibacter sp.]